MKNPSATPSLETLAADYAAALRQQDEANRAVERVLESIKRHGYTEEEVQSEAVWLLLAWKAEAS